MDLNTLWFLILGALLAAYVILDGYDLGIGVISLFTANRKQRDHLLGLIGPYWDGNEVWLVIAGGVLFAVFPGAYAALLSGFYPHFVLLLLAFIARGLAIDLRSKYASAAWRRVWDLCFGGASLLVVALVGVVGANLAHGVPTDGAGQVHADFGSSVGLDALVVAALTVALLTMHGALYASWRSLEDQRDKARKWAWAAWTVTLVLTVPAVALNASQTVILAARQRPVPLAAVVSLLVVFLLCVPWALRGHRHGRAFFSSSLAIVQLLAGLALLLHPRLIRSAVDDSQSLTIYNTAASRSALIIMLVILAITIPLAIGYMVFVRVVLERSPGPKHGYDSAR